MRTSWRLVLCALFPSALSMFSGCGGGSDGDAPPPAPAVVPPPGKLCGDGFEPIEGEAGCTPVLAREACAPGTRAAIGSASCVPVGATACAPGFARDPSGWGCDAVISKAACATGSGTRERLGMTGCVPVSDCNAAFPPAGATLFVDAAFADGQLDTTHFRSIADAVAAAPSGATIAVESGTYVEKVTLKHRKVSIVGRCAEKVLMKQVDGVIGSGIEINTNDDALLKNLTLRGYNAGVSVLGGAAKLDSVIIEDGLLAGVVAGNPGTEVHLTNVVVRGMQVRADNNQAFGAFASAGATMVIEDSVLSGNEFVNVGLTRADTTVRLSRSIVRDGKPFGPQPSFGMGVYAAEGAAVTIEETAIVDNTNAGLNVFTSKNGASSATMKRSVIRRTKRDTGLKQSRGLEITGGTLVVEGSTIGGSSELELIVSTGANAQISDTTLLGAAPTGPTERGALGLVTDSSVAKARSLAIVSPRAGVELQGNGKLTMDASLVSATRTAPTYYEDGHWIGIGMLVESKASLVLSSSTIQDVHTIGVLVTGNADVQSTLVRGTRAGNDGFGGRGLCIQNGGAATVSRSAFIDNIESGVIVQLGGAKLSMTGSTVKDTGLDHEGHFGMGLLFGGDASGTVDTSTITGSKGVGVTVAAASAFVDHTTISRNVVGVHTQDGTSLTQADVAGDDLSLVISNDTRFIDNTTRVGSGVVPLPVVLDPKAKR